MDGSFTRWAAPFGVWALSWIPLPAATLEVLVRERDGGVISNQPVQLEADSWFVPAVPPRRTGANGKVIFDRIPPGTYRATLPFLGDTSFVAPKDNPYELPPLWRIGSEADQLSVVIELWRGAPVTLEWTATPGGGLATVVFSHDDGSGILRDKLGSAEKLVKTLVPGRWTISLVGPEGYLLTDLEVNGASLPGGDAKLDLTGELRSRFVTWRLIAPCLIHGKLKLIGQPVGAYEVTATLIEPGPWHAAAVAGARPIPSPATSRVVGDGDDYRLRLVNGLWRLEPHGAGVEAAVPALVEVRLAPGETRQVNFELHFGDAAPAGGLLVWVDDPRRRPVANARVEARRLLADGTLGEVVATAMTSPMTATLPELPKGRYMIVAGHENYLEGQTELDWDPENPERLRTTVTLRDGGGVVVRATDPQGEPVANLRIEIALDAERPQSLLSDDELLRRKARASARTDAAGRASVHALYPGRYRVEAFRDGGMALALATGSASGDRVEEFELRADERVELDLTVLAAAGMTGTLACNSGTLPAPYAAVRLMPINTRLARADALAAERVWLRGPGLNRFDVGPLEEGAYLLAVRPAGIETWTWYAKSLFARGATVIQVEDRALVNLGVVVIECGPVVEIEARFTSGAGSADLDSARVSVRASRAGPAGPEPVLVRSDHVSSQVLVTGAPEGALRLSTRIEHPHFVPPVVEVTTTLNDLVRGKLARVTVDFDRLGGALEVHSTRTVAVRLRTSPDRTLVAPESAGVVRVPGLVPGSYDVEECADADCSRAVRTWAAVEVSPGKTTFLPP